MTALKSSAFSPKGAAGVSQKHHAVLGVSALAHDPAACLIVDGQLIGAVEEERLNRQKRTEAFPALAIKSLLDRAGLELSEVDALAYYWADRRLLPRALLRTLVQLPEQPRGIAEVAVQRLWSWSSPRALRAQLAALCDGDHSRVPPLAFIDHHEAHATAAWLSAPFEADGSLIIDGRGEYAASSLYKLPDRRSRRTPVRIKDYAFPNSLGVFFGAITQCLGYRAIADEYKVMGLASYGRPTPKYREAVRRFLQVRDDGSYQLNLRWVEPARCSDGLLPWLSDEGRREFAGSYHEPDGSFSQDAADLAFATQELLEVAIAGLVRQLVAAAQVRRLVISGGVAMNAKAIGHLRNAALVEQLHVPLAPTDAGSCVGAALSFLRRTGGKIPEPDALSDPFLGPAYGEREIEAVIRQAGWPLRRAADPAREAAEDIAAGRLIGWFDGRMEFGERALGARSILGDPRRADTRDRINASVKRRESYRPFAPSVLEEQAPTYFDVVQSRRMGEIVRAHPIAQERVPATVHVDGTARPQTVPCDWPIPSFRRLLESFETLTGVPMVVNTSFNIRQEPIVCSPEDALRCFAASGLDHLYMGPFVLSKQSTGNP